MAEKEYIEREAAIEIMMQYCPDDDGTCSKAFADLREALDEIESIHAADVRPVVLCKDCLHDDCAMYHSPNWFCADGEKREES